MSGKKELQQIIEGQLIKNILEMIEDTDSEEEEDNELFVLSLLALNEERYLEPRIYNVAKSQHWYNDILPTYDDVRFKRLMKMDPQSFQHSIFQSTGNKQQTPIELQLAIFL